VDPELSNLVIPPFSLLDGLGRGHRVQAKPLRGNGWRTAEQSPQASPPAGALRLPGWSREHGTHVIARKWPR